MNERDCRDTGGLDQTLTLAKFMHAADCSNERASSWTRYHSPCLTRWWIAALSETAGRP